MWGVPCCIALRASRFLGQWRFGAFAVLVAFLGAPVGADAALITPPGLSPGDTYQLVFVTSGTTAATSKDIADYNAFVQAAAITAGMGSITWRALGSSLGVEAHANALVTAPVYNLNGELVATGFADFWDGTHAGDIDFDETNSARNTNVWTGTLGSGASGGAGNALGEATPWWGESTLNASAAWTARGTNANTVSYSLYALSEQLTFVPEPGAVGLLAILLAAPLACRRPRDGPPV